MASSGTPISEIAAELGVHPNSITQHLHFRVAYEPEVLEKINTTPPRLCVDFPMPLLQAAPLLPGWPSPSRIYNLCKAGIITGSKTQVAVGSRKTRAVLVTKAQLRKAAKAIMPEPGVFIKSSSIGRFTTTCDTKKLGRHHFRYWPSREFFWIKATELEQMQVPAAQIHHAMICLELTGRATLA